MLEKSRFTDYMKNISSDKFLVFGVSFIILFSIYLRSIIDVGADTGIYLSLGKKVFLGQKYYYDFFESNFPISFYIYALEYFLAKNLGINVILMSEIVVNIIGLGSILFSAKVLKKSELYADRTIYNFLILAFACGYFLRPLALCIGEFGTKTSFVLALLYPYISYSLAGDLGKKDLALKGVLMGLIPCFKPHYLLFILVVEGYAFLKDRNAKSLISLDKMVMLLVGAVYLILMAKYISEFFEFIVPMWPKNYSAYDNWGIFFENILKHLSSRIGVFALVFLVFTRVKIDKNDLILILFFAASSLILLLESIGTVDQVSLFYVVSTILLGKCCIKFFRSKKFRISENLFICGSLFVIPFFDMDIMPLAFFGLSGILNIWWILVPIYLLLEVGSCERFLKVSAYKIVGATMVLLAMAIILFTFFGPWAYLSFSILAMLLVCYFAEVKILSRIYDRYSKFLVFLVILVFSFLFFSYLNSIFWIFDSKKIERKDFYAYYAKSYANNSDDKLVMLARRTKHNYPVSNYLNKENILKFHILTIDASHSKNGSSLIFENDDMMKNFTYNYLFDDVKKSVSNKDVKVLIISNSREVVEKDDLCIINPLEFYFMDYDFKKDFFDHFDFENRVLIMDKKRKIYNPLIKKSEVVNNIKYDYEIYVRKTEE